ncbi:Holliday junction resolvase RuvX [Candidatus Nitrosacidococcus tergens]|uniref:Putative pre-16S rRNA nuclease n=1 Tax=Candidatus Nitrosacidococcus tergens TaxID=553981 RepID=A0A7G1Q7X7_9GAMM|nr:Holliday junction resolvase RuvX [Candidatus Nitrosacidococcus tergens]CAB1274639.1 Holliday junction resolvase [Candidatus Nitrosacidococcus tergens]
MNHIKATKFSTRPRVVLGFDFGLSYIGVAVGQEITYTANPLTTLRARNGTPNWDQVTQLIEQWHPDLLVVGLPLNMDQSEQPLTHAASRFGHRLQGRYGLTVEWIDERLSTAEAWEQVNYKSSPRGHRCIDQLAAQCILQTWLREQ